MEKNLDKIAQAYFGDLGPLMAQKTRSRVQWIIKNTAGTRILDIGCSQGLIPILLAKEGKQVTGIDISKQSIQYAKALLAKENEPIRNHVEFIHQDFLQENIEERYDSVLITEVLEHLYDSQSFIKKAYSLLNPEGQVIITVPFGINDFPDHKRTLYVLELYKELYPFFTIEDVCFLGKWIGFIGRKNGTPNERGEFQFPVDLVEKMEKSFYQVERELMNQTNKQKQQLTKFKEQTDKMNKEQQELKQKEETIKSENRTLKERVAILEGQAVYYEERNNMLQRENERLVEAKDNHIADLKEQLGEKNKKMERMSTQLEIQGSQLRDIAGKVKDFDHLHPLVTKEINTLAVGMMKEMRENHEEGKTLVRQTVETIRSLDRGISSEFEKNLNAAATQKEEWKNTIINNQSQLTGMINQTLVEVGKSNELVSGVLNSLRDSARTTRNEFHILENRMDSYMENAIPSEKLQEEEAKSARLLKECKELKHVYESTLQQKKQVEERLEKALLEKEELSSEITLLQARYNKDMVRAKENNLMDLQQGEEAMNLLREEKEKYKELNQRYMALKNSKLGKVTIRYWGVKSKMKGHRSEHSSIKN